MNLREIQAGRLIQTGMMRAKVYSFMIVGYCSIYTNYTTLPRLCQYRIELDFQRVTSQICPILEMWSKMLPGPRHKISGQSSNCRFLLAGQDFFERL